MDGEVSQAEIERVRHELRLLKLENLRRREQDRLPKAERRRQNDEACGSLALFFLFISFLLLTWAPILSFTRWLIELSGLCGARKF
jgi:hypothetical protein